MAAANHKREGRFMCSELVTVHWVNEFGHEREATGTLEEIWASGAQLQLPCPVRAGTRLLIRATKAELTGAVRACTADFIGHFIEIDFENNYRWSREQYEPEHLFDPQSLVPRDELKDRNNELLALCSKLLDSRVA